MIKRQLLLPSLFVLILFLLIGNVAKGQFFNEQGLKINKFFTWLELRYVDSVNLDKISDELIRESLHKLDPHSAYITKDELEAMNEPLVGNFDGIGISFRIYNDTIYVSSVIAGCPSDKAGIKTGDRIVKIENEKVAGVGITTRQVMSKLKGKKGTVVNIDIKRQGLKEPISFSLKRDKIPYYSIDASYKIDSATGYIRLSRFSQTTMKEVTDDLKQFKDANINNLVLDLSGNVGGLLEVAVSLADEFLDADKLIVYTKGLHSSKREYFSTSNGMFEKGKLVIITDEGSASAAEILAGAIQDWDRGLIVGRRTFGKGLVQSQMDFPDGSAIRLTIARYYTPTGRLIQKPYDKGYDEYSKDISKRFKHGELVNKDSIHQADSLKFYTLVHKRLVFGGGGIMPDVFVPLDTIDYSPYYRNLFAKGTITNFVLNYLDSNRKELSSKYSDFNRFKEEFSITSNLLSELKAFAIKDGVQYKETEFKVSQQLICIYLKAAIAQSMWGNNEFWEIYNLSSPAYKKAVESIKN